MRARKQGYLMISGDRFTVERIGGVQVKWFLFIDPMKVFHFDLDQS